MRMISPPAQTCRHLPDEEPGRETTHEDLHLLAIQEAPDKGLPARNDLDFIESPDKRPRRPAILERRLETGCSQRLIISKSGLLLRPDLPLFPRLQYRWLLGGPASHEDGPAHLFRAPQSAARMQAWQRDSRVFRRQPMRSRRAAACMGRALVLMTSSPRIPMEKSCTPRRARRMPRKKSGRVPIPPTPHTSFCALR